MQTRMRQSTIAQGRGKKSVDLEKQMEDGQHREHFQANQHGFIPPCSEAPPPI